MKKRKRSRECAEEEGRKQVKSKLLQTEELHKGNRGSIYARLGWGLEQKSKLNL